MSDGLPDRFESLQRPLIDLLGLVTTPAAAHWDASFTVECTEATWRKREFDEMREIPFVRKAGDL